MKAERGETASEEVWSRAMHHPYSIIQRMLSLNLMMKTHQKKTRFEIFYKITCLYCSEISRDEDKH
jgi:hypothetical protein